MQTLQARLTYLRNAEAGFGLLFPVVFMLHWQRSGDAVAWEVRGAVLALVSWILLQGAVYWHLKLTALRRRQPLPSWFLPVFRFCRLANWLLLGAIGVLVAVNKPAPADLAWTCGFLAFAVLEQVNYYYFQLMYDTRAALSYLRRNGRLRRAALGLDLARRPSRLDAHDRVAQ